MKLPLFLTFPFMPIESLKISCLTWRQTYVIIFFQYSVIPCFPWSMGNFSSQHFKIPLPYSLEKCSWTCPQLFLICQIFISQFEEAENVIGLICHCVFMWECVCMFVCVRASVFVCVCDNLFIRITAPDIREPGAGLNLPHLLIHFSHSLSVLELNFSGRLNWKDTML